VVLPKVVTTPVVKSGIAMHQTIDRELLANLPTTLKRVHHDWYSHHRI
jgi:hypothetical protein